jgi:hypothetical protein
MVSIADSDGLVPGDQMARYGREQAWTRIQRSSLNWTGSTATKMSSWPGSGTKLMMLSTVCPPTVHVGRIETGSLAVTATHPVAGLVDVLIVCGVGSA